MINVLSVDEQVILTATSLMPSVMAVMNLTTLPRTALTRFLQQEHPTTKKDLIQGIDTSTTRGAYHIPIMVRDIGDISADHSPTLILTMTEATVLEGTAHTLLPATSATCTTPQPINAPITLCTMIPPGMVTLYPTLATSPIGATHATP